MEPTKVLSQIKLPPQRYRRPLWLVLALASLIPGAGHLYLRNLPLAAGLFLVTTLSAVSAAVLSYFGFDHPAWLFGRISVLSALFSIVDATLGAAEEADRRAWRRCDRPRLVAYLNLLTYGIGTWRLGERVAGGVCVGLGLVLHGWLAALNLPLAVLAELGVLAMAVHGYVLAHAIGQPVSTAPGNLDGGARSIPPADGTPAWVVPTLSGVCIAVLLLALGGSALKSTLFEAMEVDQSRTLAMEPFYRNPIYGLSLEMNAPGWNFRAAEPNEFLVAQHMAEDTMLRVSVQPRLPLLSGDRTAAVAVLAEAMLEEGYLLNVTQESKSIVGGQPGYRVHAKGMHGDRPREVMLLTAGKGWRQYVVWFEWSPEHERFARAEAAYVESTLSVENGTPARPERQPMLAR